jgi:hypothetical protein
MAGSSDGWTAMVVVGAEWQRGVSSFKLSVSSVRLKVFTKLFHIIIEPNDCKSPLPEIASR